MVLLTISGKSTTINSYNTLLNQKSVTIYNTTPAFFGITTFGSKVNLQLFDNKKVLKLVKETTAISGSRFTINITKEDKLPMGTYSVLLSASNSLGDYIEIPEFTLKIGTSVTTYVSALVVDKEIPQVSPVSTIQPVPTPTTQPTPTTESKHCFLFWCF